MGASFGGFLFGVLVVVALTERRRLSSPAFRHERRHAPRLSPAEWDEVLPPARSALRARWENSGEISEDDDWIAALAILGAAAVLALGWMFTASSLPVFATFVLFGATGAMAGYGVYAWTAHYNLPPDGRTLLVRAVIVVVFAYVVLRWTRAATYRHFSIDEIRDEILPVKLSLRPGTLSDTFHAAGWGLTASVVVARALVVAMVCRSLLDLTAMAAAVRLSEGSTRAFPAWLAQFYPRRPVRRAVSVVAMGACALILGSGLGVRWWDDVQGERPTLPVPEVTVPAETSTTTVP